MGGFYERLVGLAKRSLRKTIGKVCLSVEQLRTLLTEVEAVVNSRPLAYIGEDIDSNIVLTPSCFLTLNKHTGIPERIDNDDDPKYKPQFSSTDNLLELWKKGQKHLNRFWKVWRDDYLLSIRERTTVKLKEKRVRSNQYPQISDIVLIKDDLPRGMWKIGVQLCKHADVIRPCSVSSKYIGYLIIFKVIKGKVKQVVENHTNIPLEPTPNYDCHLVASSDCSSNHTAFFNSSQIYAYEYGEESINEIPRQVMPFAVVKFSFTPKHIVRKKTNTVGQSSSSKTSASSRPMASSVRDEGETYIVWNGALTVKGMHACNINMVSSASWFKPAKLGTDIDITHKLEANKVKQKYLKHTGKLAKNSENHSGNYYINVCELQPSKPEIKSHFQKIMNYLGKHDCIAVQKLEDVILLLLTQGQLSYQLGLSQPHQYPVVLYCLFLSRNSRKKNSGSEEEDDKDKDRESHSLSDKSKVEEIQEACGKTMKDDKGGNSTVCDMELCDSGESNIAVSLPIVQLSSPCDHIVSSSKSPSICIQNTFFESPTSLGTKLSENDSPKLDKISPTKVTPEILKLPPDYPYKNIKKSASILNHLDTFGRTNENYVVATVWDNGKLTGDQSTPVREGGTTPVRFVSPPTPGTPTLDERKMMHYYTSPLEKSQDDPNNNRNISSIQFNPSPHLDRKVESSQQATSEQCSRITPQPPSLHLEESITRDLTDKQTCPHLEKEVDNDEISSLEKNSPVSKDQSQLVHPGLTSNSLQLDKSNNSSSSLLQSQPGNESICYQNVQSEENPCSKSLESTGQSSDKSCITSTHRPVSLKCIPLSSCEKAVSSDLFPSCILSVSKNSNLSTQHSPETHEPISTVGQSNSPLKFKTSSTSPQFIHSPASQVSSPQHTSPRLPTIYQLAFQSAVSRQNASMYSPPSYNTFPQRHWSLLGYQHCYNYNRMSTPLRCSGYYEPRMTWPPWELSPPRPLLPSPPYPHRKPSLLGVALQGVQPWGSRPVVPLIGNVDSVRSRLQVNPAPSCSFKAISLQETDSLMMKTQQQNTSNEMSAPSPKPGQNANEIGHQRQPQTVRNGPKLNSPNKFSVPATVISPIKPVTVEVEVFKPLVPYTDTENNCISEPLVPYTEISEEVVICKPLVPYTDVGNDVVQSVEAVHHSQELLQNSIEPNSKETEPNRELFAGHVGSNFIRIPDGEQQTETSIAGNKSLDKYETGFMTKPPKSSLIQQVKIKDDFRVQEKAHELHSILKRSPRLIVTTGKGDDYAPKIDFSEELSMKQEPVDDTIDNIIQFLDFDSKSPGTSKVNKSGIESSIKMNSSNKKVNSSSKKGNEQKQPHTVTNKDVENMRKLLNDTLEKTSPKKKSNGDYKNTRRQSGEICLDKVVESQENSQKIVSKQVKGSLKHPLTENSSEEFVACKKIKLETDKDKLPILGSVQAMEITTCSDSSDLEFIDCQPPPVIDLTSPVVDLTESPSPIRIVRTVTGYIVEKSCKTKLIVDTDSKSERKLKMSNISTRLKDSEKDQQISNEKLLNENEDNMKASKSKSKAKISGNEEKKVKCPENLKYGSKNEEKTDTKNIKQSVNKPESKLKSQEKTSKEREKLRVNSALNLKKTDKSVEKCKTESEKKEKSREKCASDSKQTDQGCEKSKLCVGSKTNYKDNKESDLKKKINQ
ncbi:FAM208A [Mytilus coruscus]|uniref:FAM208A n=1 Tax=Mytilus coruscus TaxID=42192 RepID=A0A6J8DYW3_MYTCO|nr:FAM208A [Mytilus coruscus]